MAARQGTNTHLTDHKVHPLSFVADNTSTMKSLLPLKPSVETTQDGAHVVSIAEEAADEVFKTLSSSTARLILSALYEKPRPASELAAETDTTVQNVRYHLNKLQDAGLITAADTWYSEKGAEMTVYAPTESALVVCAGRQSTTDRLKSTIKKLLGAVAIFGLASLLVQYFVTNVLQSEPASRSRFASDSASGSEAMDAAAVGEQATGGGFSALLSEPGVVFFMGCLLALAVVVVLSARQ